MIVTPKKSLATEAGGSLEFLHEERRVGQLKEIFWPEHIGEWEASWPPLVSIISDIIRWDLRKGPKVPRKK
jgi:hypothetical protein